MRKPSKREIVLFLLLLLLNILVFYLGDKNPYLISSFFIIQIPAILAGLLLSPQMAFLSGLIGPAISIVIFKNIQIYPYGVVNVIQLAFMSLLISIFNNKANTKELISTLLGYIFSNVIKLIVIFILVIITNLNIEPINYIQNELQTAILGLIINLIFIPLIMKILNRYTTINID